MTHKTDWTPATRITALDGLFGAEWRALTHPDQLLILRDCTEDGGVEDLAQYRRDIGVGNLETYARPMRVRFSRNRFGTRDGCETHNRVDCNRCR